jgi:predicted anti-sigma-YlaC factor YlaD
MRCDRFREAASARLDGEPIGVSATALEHHLATCRDCARWNDDAVRLTRQLRVGAADESDTDALTARIMADAVLPVGRVLRRRRWLRVGLAVLGVIQLGLAFPSLFGTSIDMAMSMHAAHETAAWNVAVGVALLASALQPKRAMGVLPVLLAFVGVLTVLSVHDVASGAVAAGRLATHAATVAGLVLVYALHRVERALPPDRWSAQPADVETSESGGDHLRGVA